MNIFPELLRETIAYFYRFTGDYGIAIVLVTVIIRSLMIPLNLKQRKSLEKQQEISRTVEELKKKYGTNQKKLNDELQKLYQERGTGMSGCLLGLLQFPIMMCLYHAIRLTAAIGATTLLLPWIPSLLVRDPIMLLPFATLFVQVLPQLFPYIRFFESLHLQKSPFSTIAVMLGMNAMFVFVIPSGIGLYYFISGLFTAAEQLICNVIAVRKINQHAAA